MAMIFHPHKDWVDPKMPVVGPAISWPAIDTVAIHYTAALNLIDGDPGENASSLPAYIRAIHRDYTVNKGYSIGYNFAIDWLGGIWELRGHSIKCAANKGHNNHVVAILMLVDGADPTTPEGAASVRWLIGEMETRAKRQLFIKGHQELPAATGCPGKGLLNQIHLGKFSPRYQEPAPPPLPVPPNYDPTLDPEVDEMTPVRVRFQGYANVFLLTSGGYIHLTQVLSPFFNKYQLVVSDAHPQGMKCALSQAGLTMSDMVPTPDGS